MLGNRRVFEKSELLHFLRNPGFKGGAKHVRKHGEATGEKDSRYPLIINYL